MTTMRELRNIVMGLSSDELGDLGLFMKERRNELNRGTIRELRIGDDVKFDAGNRGIIKGTVTKINKKTVMVLEKKNTGRTCEWRVTASILEKL